ncbi:MAG: sialidase family protein [Bryobacterales bacterium]
MKLAAIFAFALLMGCSVADRDELLPELSLQPPKILTNAGPEFAKDKRGAQGVPTIERAPNGRLWAAWYTGPETKRVESPFSYVVLATSGDDGSTWQERKLVIQPTQYVRAMDPCLWIDPQGRLWLFWAQSAGLRDGRWGVWAMRTDTPEEESLEWSEPRRISNGIMLNKPTVLENGAWLLPVGLWRDSTPDLALDGYDLSPYKAEDLTPDLGEEKGSNVLISRDQGDTFEMWGQARAPNTRVDEHMIVERKDGSLLMLIRNTDGIMQSVSTDGGKTWSPGEMYQEGSNVANKRFFVRRLASGALLLVRNNGPDGKRSHLTAFVSDDDGETWQGGLLIEERVGVSYPDGVQAPDGLIYLIYDFDRAGEGLIAMATFREEDVRAGKPVSGDVRLGVEVSRLRPAE